MKNNIQTINFGVDEIPIVISIPHSGTIIPENIKKLMNDDLVLPNMDWYLPKLYSFLEKLNYTVVVNNISRYVIDCNRDLKTNENDDYRKSLIYSNTTYNDSIYKYDVTNDDINERINLYYKPYHQVLNEALINKVKKFGYVYLIDLHSFGLNYDVDFILGNANNESSSLDFINYFSDKLSDYGYRVKKNFHYSGGFITKHYSQIIDKCEALQIEIFYRTYIDDRDFEKEEFPDININLFNNTQANLMSFFLKLKKDVLTFKK